MAEILAQFHWLRPLWLLAIIPAFILAVMMWRQHGRNTGWQQLIAPDLLQFLLDKTPTPSSRVPVIGLLIAWIVCSLALAGPTWQQLPQPVHKTDAGVAVLWDMSPSMLAEDVKPSRLIRSRYKLIDYLQARHEGLTGLVAYAGEAHVISPLTDDTNTIINLLPALEPGIMPLQGSNTEMAVELGIQLLKDAGLERGELLLVTDGVEENAQAAIAQLLNTTPYQLSILGVGTDEGAPIPTGSAGFARDGDNNVIIAKLGARQLNQLANHLGGTYTTLAPDNRDIDQLIDSATILAENSGQQREIERNFDQWRDAGQYLVLLLLPLVALAFRRGWVLNLCAFGIFASAFYTAPSHAFEWDDLWLRSDQQGQKALDANRPEEAAQTFKTPDWQGTAHYRGENYQAAADAFAKLNSADANYNRGNALAKAGQLEAALEAYENALDQQSDFEDAAYNAEIIRKLLEQQQNQQGGSGENSNQEQQDGDQQQQNAQNSNTSQNQSQQNSEQSSSQQQASSEQSDSSQQNAQNQNQDKSSQQANTSQDQPSQAEEEAAKALADRDGERAAQQKMQADENQDQESRRQQRLAQKEQNQAEPNESPQHIEGLAEHEPTSEEQQALDQWLRQIPDDPSGLLRRKLEYQHRQLRQRYRMGQWEPPENDAYNRW